MESVVEVIPASVTKAAESAAEAMVGQPEATGAAVGCPAVKCPELLMLEMASQMGLAAVKPASDCVPSIAAKRDPEFQLPAYSTCWRAAGPLPAGPALIGLALGTPSLPSRAIQTAHLAPAMTHPGPFAGLQIALPWGCSQSPVARLHHLGPKLVQT